VRRVARAHKLEDLAVPTTLTATQPLRTPTAMELPSQRTSLRAATTVRVLPAVLGSTVVPSAIVTQPPVYAFVTPVSHLASKSCLALFRAQSAGLKADASVV